MLKTVIFKIRHKKSRGKYPPNLWFIALGNKQQDKKTFGF